MKRLFHRGSESEIEEVQVLYLCNNINNNNIVYVKVDSLKSGSVSKVWISPHVCTGLQQCLRFLKILINSLLNSVADCLMVCVLHVTFYHDDHYHDDRPAVNYGTLLSTSLFTSSLSVILKSLVYWFINWLSGKFSTATLIFILIFTRR